MTDLVERVADAIEQPFLPHGYELKRHLLKAAARAAIEAQSDTITRLKEALAWFARRGDTLIREVQTAHSGRGAAASEWMREDDADFRSDLREAVEKARALSVGGE